VKRHIYYSVKRNSLEMKNSNSFIYILILLAVFSTANADIDEFTANSFHDQVSYIDFDSDDLDFLIPHVVSFSTAFTHKSYISTVYYHDADLALPSNSNRGPPLL